MRNSRELQRTQGRVPLGLQKVLRQLPRGGLERRAIEAGEIDAVIDYASANVIMFPAARRALRDVANRASVGERRPALELPARNGVLLALPRAEYRRLLPALEVVELESGQVLHEAGTSIRHVYFPVNCVVGLLTRIENEMSVATGLVGPEGMVGMPLAFGVGVSSTRAVVQVAGSALRMKALQFRHELERGLFLKRHLYRYAQVKLNQARQAAACLSAHSIEQRLACWLLMIAHRAKSKEILLTQEHLGDALNVRRESITSASGSLRSCGVITYVRGRISILDRKGLEAAACRCHRLLADDEAMPAVRSRAERQS